MYVPVGFVEGLKLNLRTKERKERSFKRDLSEREKIAVIQLTTPRKRNRYCPCCWYKEEELMFHKHHHHHQHHHHHNNNNNRDNDLNNDDDN